MKKRFFLTLSLLTAFTSPAFAIELLGCNGSTPAGPTLLADEVGSPACSANPTNCHWIVQAAWYTEILGAIVYVPSDPALYGGSDTEAGCKTALKNMMSQGVIYDEYASVHQWLRYLPTLRAICYPQALTVSAYMARHKSGWQGKEYDQCP